ncbi:MAG: stage II sporulation protein R [Clostridia bacterium]|nr:stage II sporulation protein R [Clostridia bacterium]
MKRKSAEIAVASALIISVLISFFGFGKQCNEIRNDVLRLHILADSDSEEDQSIKLKVRDALLNSGNEIFSGKTDIENVKDIFEKEKNMMINIVNGILIENGFDYTSDIYLSKEYFTTRTYGDYTLPAGNYLAVKVILGEGKGHNWWCVMFPPLCLPAATPDERELDEYFNRKNSQLIKSNPQYDVRFKLIEIIEYMKIVYNIH